MDDFYGVIVGSAIYFSFPLAQVLAVAFVLRKLPAAAGATPWRYFLALLTCIVGYYFFFGVVIYIFSLLRPLYAYSYGMDGFWDLYAVALAVAAMNVLATTVLLHKTLRMELRLGVQISIRVLMWNLVVTLIYLPLYLPPSR